MSSDPRVDGVDKNLIRYASGDPNDAEFPFQSPVFTSRLPAAWDKTHGNPATDIAILDTGVDLDHPDLAPRIVAGYDFVNNDANPQDDEGHGTFVAGIAAADSNNSIGIAGAAWDARIMPVKVLGADGSGNDGNVASGIVWATDHGAEVVNLSIGAPGESSILEDAIDYAVAHGVVVVAASGNEASDVPSYPAAYGPVISVGATEEHGDVVWFSNRGPSVDVVAQGYNVVSTTLAPGTAETYGVSAGTSFAAPLVSGIVALVHAVSPAATPAQVQSWIKATAIDRGPRGIDDFYGWGLIDAYAAVGGRTAASPPGVRSDFGEPNDVADRAGPVLAAQGKIQPEGDVDWYYVDAEAPGTISITVTSLGGAGEAISVDTVLSAWSPLLDALGAVNATGPGGVEVLILPVLEPGRYRFRVSSAASSRSIGSAASPSPYTVNAVASSGVASDGPAERLWVRNVRPADFAEKVPAAVHPTVTFARDIDPSSITPSTIKLRDGKTGADVASTRTFDPASDTVTITPSASLVAGRPYVLSATGVQDVAANVMTQAHTARFTVAAPKTSSLDSDFNKDGFDDVVIGAPNEDSGSKKDTGVVHVLYGSTGGAKTTGSQMWSQDSSGIADGGEPGDLFGFAVATGDLNKDGYDDLAIGAPAEDIGTIADAGVVHVLLGSPSGLRASGSKMWSQNSTGVPGASEKSDRFGSALAMGNFDAFGGDDLAVGAPGEAIGPFASAGSVTVLRGSSGGLTSSGAQQWTQDSAGIDFFADPGDAFGAALATGDFQGDRNDELAIGAPGDDVDAGDEGSVAIMRGSVVGLRPAGLLVDVIPQDQNQALSETPEPGDAFGQSVEIADVGGYGAIDGYADLVVGVPGQDIGGLANAGAVRVIYSDHSGPWIGTQTLSGADVSSGQAGARFGSKLAGGVTDRSIFKPTIDAVRGELFVGAPLADDGEHRDAGNVAVFVSGPDWTATNLVALDGTVVWEQSGTLSGNAEPKDYLGAAVSMADVDGDGWQDGIFAAPGEDVGSAVDAGSVAIVRKRGNAPGDPVKFALILQSSSGVPSAPETGDKLGASVG